jgi:hypothetical protein
MYNHSDSYPSGLGVAMVEATIHLLTKTGLEKMIELAKAIRLVDEHTDKPTDADIERLSKYADTNVSNQTTKDWYCLLRHAQGDIEAIFKAGVMIDGHEFVRDSLFCEWGYILNLDDKVLEVYRGFQETAHNKGRFAKTPKLVEEGRDGKKRDYSIALVKKIRFTDLIVLKPSETGDLMNKIEKAVRDADKRKSIASKKKYLEDGGLVAAHPSANLEQSKHAKLYHLIAAQGQSGINLARIIRLAAGIGIADRKKVLDGLAELLADYILYGVEKK